jgi:hypothetical protein
MATPTLKRSWGFVGISGNSPDTGNNYKIQLEAAGTPRAVASGDLILVSVAFANGLTCTVSGDVSGSFASAISVADATLAVPRKFQIFWVLATGVDTVITVGFGALHNDIQIDVSVWYNTASSSPLDGAGIATTQITGPTVATGAFTVTVGDLIYNIAWDEQNGNIDQVGSPLTAISYGTNFTGLCAEHRFGKAAQYQIATSTSVNPSMTFSQATNDVFTSIAIAIKAGTSGSAPGTGISIVKSQMAFFGGQAGNQPCSFPTVGNLVVVANDVAAGGEQINSIVDTNSNTYTAIPGITTGCQLFHADNATTGNALVLTINLTNNSGNVLMALYDIAGAATSPIDTAAAAANASTLTQAGSGATQHGFTESSTTAADLASITPSTAHGLLIDVGSIGTGPATACTTGTYDYVAATWNVGGGDQNGFLNGDLMAHFFNASAATENFTFTVVNNSSSISAVAVAFKAAPAAAATPWGWHQPFSMPQDRVDIVDY